jgi:hypothetical protein
MISHIFFSTERSVLRNGIPYHGTKTKYHRPFFFVKYFFVHGRRSSYRNHPIQAGLWGNDHPDNLEAQEPEHYRAVFERPYFRRVWGKESLRGNLQSERAGLGV